MQDLHGTTESYCNMTLKLKERAKRRQQDPTFTQRLAYLMLRGSNLIIQRKTNLRGPLLGLQGPTIPWSRNLRSPQEQDLSHDVEKGTNIALGAHNAQTSKPSHLLEKLLATTTPRIKMFAMSFKKLSLVLLSRAPKSTVWLNAGARVTTASGYDASQLPAPTSQPG